MQNRQIVGIIAIILGILVIAFPLSGVSVFSFLAGLGILFLGLYFIIGGANLWAFSKGISVTYIILGLIGFIFGIMLIGNLALFSILISLYFYIAGFMLIIAGALSLFARVHPITKGAAAIMLVLGIITVILGAFAMMSPFYVAIILGISLIIDGIAIYLNGEEFIGWN